jgi:hypothetical protein
MSNIILLYVLYHRRKIFLAPVESIVGKISNFEKFFLVGDSRDNVVKFLEFFFRKIRKLVDSLDVILVKLFFVVENYIVVCLIKYESSVILLDGRVFFRVLLDIIRIRLHGDYLFHRETYQTNNYHDCCRNR